MAEDASISGRIRPLRPQIVTLSAELTAPGVWTGAQVGATELLIRLLNRA